MRLFVQKQNDAAYRVQSCYEDLAGSELPITVQNGEYEFEICRYDFENQVVSCGLKEIKEMTENLLKALNELEKTVPEKLSKDDFSKLSDNDKMNYLNDISVFLTGFEVLFNDDDEHHNHYYDYDDQDKEIVDLYDYALDLNTWGDFSGQIFKD